MSNAQLKYIAAPAGCTPQNEPAVEAGQLGTIIISYRSGGFDRFPNALRASAEAIADKIYGDAGGFRGVVRISDDDCLAVINLAEVESILWTVNDQYDQYSPEDQQ